MALSAITKSGSATRAPKAGNGEGDDLAVVASPDFSGAREGRSGRLPGGFAEGAGADFTGSV